jgi:hypothetical protein
MRTIRTEAPTTLAVPKPTSDDLQVLCATCDAEFSKVEKADVAVFSRNCQHAA